MVYVYKLSKVQRDSESWMATDKCKIQLIIIVFWQLNHISIQEPKQIIYLLLTDSHAFKLEQTWKKITSFVDFPLIQAISSM